jgi:hypothetical protein
MASNVAPTSSTIITFLSNNLAMEMGMWKWWCQAFHYWTKPHANIQPYCEILLKIMKKLPRGLDRKAMEFERIST